MFAIDVLVEEHKNILRMTEVIRSQCISVMEGNEVPVESFCQVIDFIRNYADKHHHGKEEQILFQKMTECLGPVADKLVRNGMLVEHDLGRLYVSELEDALKRYQDHPDMNARLDIVANAAGYARLLKRHAEKENAVVFTFAGRQLTDEVFCELNERTRQFEREAEKRQTQVKYLKMLKYLETL